MRLEEMSTFFDFARKSGTVAPNAIHNWSGAISAICHCLDEEERTVEFLHGHPKVVRERLLNGKREISSRSIDAYLARSTTAITNFLAWKADPENWKQELVTRPRRGRGRARSLEPASPREKNTAKAQAGSADTAAAPQNTLRIRTEGGGVVTLEFPDRIMMNDVLRAAWALAVHARDFDPEETLRGFGKPPMIRSHGLRKVPPPGSHGIY